MERVWRRVWEGFGGGLEKGLERGLDPRSCIFQKIIENAHLLPQVASLNDAHFVWGFFGVHFGVQNLFFFEGFWTTFGAILNTFEEEGLVLGASWERLGTPKGAKSNEKVRKTHI